MLLSAQNTVRTAHGRRISPTCAPLQQGLWSGLWTLITQQMGELAGHATFYFYCLLSSMALGAAWQWCCVSTARPLILHGYQKWKKETNQSRHVIFLPDQVRSDQIRSAFTGWGASQGTVWSTTRCSTLLYFVLLCSTHPAPIWFDGLDAEVQVPPTVTRRESVTLVRIHMLSL